MHSDTRQPYLLYMHIASLLCWAFDVITTFYVISHLGVAVELNPLGWPFGAWGTLMFYIPALVFTYLLLFRMQHKYSTWAATFITAIAVGFAIMNFLAGLHNIEVASLYA